MTQSSATGMKLFSVTSANASLPLVRVIVRDIVSMANSILECRERIDGLRENRYDELSELVELNPYEDELDEIEDSLDSDSMILKGYIEELHELGVEIRSLTQGQVEFPSMIGGQLIYLCWKYDESTVDFYREADEDFADRQPIDLMFVDAPQII